MKSTPKSCHCRQCTWSKASKTGQREMKTYERAFRHAANQAVRQGKDIDVLPALRMHPIG
ncbi:MAG: hypothetical protein JSS14_21970 [Proteobacteria bacterium]|nr:hypothetical protein [Pseudomonadota bacterium]